VDETATKPRRRISILAVPRQAPLDDDAATDERPDRVSAKLARAKAAKSRYAVRACDRPKKLVRGWVYGGAGHGKFANCMCAGGYDKQVAIEASAGPRQIVADKVSREDAEMRDRIPKWRPSLSQAPNLDELVWRPRLAWRRLSCMVRQGGGARRGGLLPQLPSGLPGLPQPAQPLQLPKSEPVTVSV